MTRDDEHRRWIIYLECASSLGRFDFDLSCDFRIDRRTFYSSDYQDPKSAEHGSRGDDWKRFLSENDQERIQQFFIGSIRIGDNYSAGQAAAIGPNARADGPFFQQIWREKQESIDLRELSNELEILRQSMREEATELSHDVAVAEVASARAAAANGKGPQVLEHLRNAGKWALDTATKIGVGVAIAALKTALGM